MRTSKLWRLLRRSKPKTSWYEFQRRNGYRIGWQSTEWKWIACDPYLHRAIRSHVFTGRETAVVTRPIYLGHTLAGDHTRTMPTMCVEAPNSSAVRDSSGGYERNLSLHAYRSTK